MQSLQKAIVRIICIFWIIAKLLSIKLWTGDRLYPIVPVIDAFTIPVAVHYILFVFSLSLISLVAIFPQRKNLTILVLIVEIISCFLDITRWQPWEYQYIFIILVFFYYHNNPQHFYKALIFILASVYIFSGLHKLNGGFLYNVWENMMLSKFAGMSKKTISDLNLHYIGLVIPIVEITAGMAVLFLKDRRWGGYILIGMHLMILLFIGPYGINYNSIVWPWNAMMILFCYLLFCRNSIDFSLSEFNGLKFNRILILFWAILPALSFLGWWDSYLSSSLYSGNEISLAICNDKNDMRAGLKIFVSKNDRHQLCPGGQVITLHHWAFKEMNVPPYPQLWYYKKFKKQWEKLNPDTYVHFITYAYPYKQKGLVE